MKKQGLNPYLPPWEYIPDGEPYIFDGRVYVYGSHDKFNGYVYCMNDYVCWSAPVDDLGDWRYEGVIFKKTDDPLNRDGGMCLYAPDVTLGPDGRYYLFYVLDKIDIVSVAVCDTPAGSYTFHGNVRYPDGTYLGRHDGDQPQFDPGVLTEGERTYLYTGFCGIGDKTRKGAMATVLGPDMLTILEGPVIVVPSDSYGKNTGFEGHEFYEASSIRKRGDTYYFVYSSILMNELCYATSKSPLKDFVYGGVIVSNRDIHIDSYKPADKPMNCGGNNHGSIIEICGKWYIFYHRHTNGTEFSRQGCVEQIEIKEDGSIPQVEVTSCGLNGGPLTGKGEYPAYLACNLFCMEEKDTPNGDFGFGIKDIRLPKLTQDGRDGDEETGFVTNILDSSGVGFKYFDCKGITKVKVKTRGYNPGGFEVKTSWDGGVLGNIPVEGTNIWKEFSADITIPDGINAIYLIYKGAGAATLGSFSLE
jgi:hypothetical protein